MDYDLISIVELCGIACLAFVLGGFCMIFIATRIGRDEFRPKGFLRPPSGLALFRFLLMKQYEAFDNSTTRLFFGYAYFCLMATIVLATAIVVLLGCYYFLKSDIG